MCEKDYGVRGLTAVTIPGYAQIGANRVNITKGLAFSCLAN